MKTVSLGVLVPLIVAFACNSGAGGGGSPSVGDVTSTDGASGDTSGAAVSDMGEAPTPTDASDDDAGTYDASSADAVAVIPDAGAEDDGSDTVLSFPPQPFELVSVAASGGAGNGVHHDKVPVPQPVSISDDGRYVAFYSTSTDLTTVGVGGEWIASCFLRDRATATTTFIGRRANGETVFQQVAGGCWVNQAGTTVLFLGSPETPGGAKQVVAEYTITAGTVRHVTEVPLKAEVRASPNGQWLSYHDPDNGLFRMEVEDAAPTLLLPYKWKYAGPAALSNAGDLLFGANPALLGVSGPDRLNLWIQTAAGEVILASRTPGGEPADRDIQAGQAYFTADGSKAFFTAEAAAGIDPQMTESLGIFVFDVVAQTVSRVSPKVQGKPFALDGLFHASRDGRYVAFSGWVTGYKATSAWVYDLALGDSHGIHLHPTDPATTLAPLYHVTMTSDGSLLGLVTPDNRFDPSVDFGAHFLPSQVYLLF